MTSATASVAGAPYIVVEGAIGVGKTSLARRLAESFNAQLLLEEAEHNPFLERFYRNPKSGALPAQMFFLLQRTRQLEVLQQHDLFASLYVADYLFAKDKLFAKLNLDAEEFALYEQMHSHLATQLPPPDLVVYLQAPTPVLLERIAKRGIRYEQGIEASYLDRLNTAYAEFFHRYDASPLFIVNAAHADFVNRDQDYDRLLQELRQVRQGRHYFNPQW